MNCYRTIDTIKSRRHAGESIESLAHDYGLSNREIANIIEPEWGIEARSTDSEFCADMIRAIVKNIGTFDSRAWIRLQSIEYTENSSVFAAVGDLTQLQWLSGVHRRVKKKDDGLMHSSICRVEIYPLGQPPIPVEFRKTPAPGMCSIDQPTITGIAKTGTVTTVWRRDDEIATRELIVDILSSRQNTDLRVLNWVLRTGQEYGKYLKTNQNLTLENYLAFFDGDFTFIAG